MKQPFNLLVGVLALVASLSAHAVPTTDEIFTLFEQDAREVDRLAIRGELVGQGKTIYRGSTCRLDTLAMHQKLMSEFFADGDQPGGAAAGRGLASKAASCAVMTKDMEGAEQPAMLAFLAGIGLFNAGRVAIMDPPKAFHQRAKLYLDYAATNLPRPETAATARKYLDFLNKMR